jgi:hypothetical protein
MRFVARAVLPTYLAALQDALEEVVRRLPTGRTRRLLAGLRQKLGSGAGSSLRRMRSLHRLAMMGEAQGWLTADESITIRKLAYRCAFYLRRAEEID